MNDNYRRKDYFASRSMRDAFGDDETFEPEIRCCSKLFVGKNEDAAYRKTKMFWGCYLAVISTLGILIYVAMQHI